MISTNPVFTGVISSLIAIILVECYRFISHKMRNQRLRQFLGFKSQSCLIVTSRHTIEIDARNDEGMLFSPAESERAIQCQISTIDHYAAYAFGHLFEMCQRVGIEPKISPHNKISETEEEGNVISIGDPLNNPFSRRVLERLFPDLTLFRQREITHLGGNVYKRLDNLRSVDIGGDHLLSRDGRDYAFIVRAGARELRQDRTVHIIWGTSGQALASATYFIYKYHKRLLKNFEDEKYFVAIPVYNESYKAVTFHYIDLTSQAFPYPAKEHRDFKPATSLLDAVDEPKSRLFKYTNKVGESVAPAGDSVSQHGDVRYTQSKEG